MVTYNTVPLSEDARLNEPKAPQNRKALIALVAAVCLDSMGAKADKAGCSRDELAAAGDKIDDLFSDHPYGAHNNICEQKKKELDTCTKIEIKGKCGFTEVITASMTC